MRHYFTFTTLSLTFFIIGLLTLSDFGVNWDAPIRMLRGQAYAQIYLTGKYSFDYSSQTSPILIKPNEHATRLNFVAGEQGEFVSLSKRPLVKKEHQDVQEQLGKRFSFYQSEAWNGNYFKDSDAAHLPLIDILSAFSNRFFYQTLGILGDLESYKIVYLLFSSIGIFLVCLITFGITNSLFASSVAGLSLALFPLFFAEAHFNSKDPIQAVFFTGSIWAFYNWVSSGKLGWFGAFGGFVALALAVKWNIIFLPLIIIPWLFLIRKTRQFKEWFKLGRLGKLGILGGLGIFLFLVAIWPYSWADPFGRIFSIFSYYGGVGFAGENSLQPDRFILPLGFNAYPSLLLLTQTPEIILVLGVFGVFWVVRGKGGELKLGYLLILWALVPLIRQSLPNMWFFNGLRQVMEILPALAILAGVGSCYLITAFKKQDKIIKTGLLISFVLLIITLIQLHPNQNAYFNTLAGGFKGAVEKNLVDWWFNYGNVYKQASLWLNQNAEKDANIALIDGSMFALSPVFLRDDISISPNHFSGLEAKGEYILQPFNPFNPPIFAHRYAANFLKAFYTINIDNVPVLTIYKNDSEFLKEGFKNEAAVRDFEVKIGQQKEGNYFEVDLGQDLLITRIILENTPARCQNTNFQLIDEFVQLIPADSINKGLGELESFGLMEKKVIDKDKVEYWFPAQKARFIRIHPQSFSCFVQGKIKQINYLQP